MKSSSFIHPTVNTKNSNCKRARGEDNTAYILHYTYANCMNAALRQSRDTWQRERVHSRSCRKLARCSNSPDCNAKKVKLKAVWY